VAAKRMIGMLVASILAAATGLPQMALAKDAGDLLIRLRGIGVITDTKGTTDLVGGNAWTSNEYVPELDFTYFFSQNVAAELILATTKHSVEVHDSDIGDLDIGTVRLIPPVLTLQYHFLPGEVFSPYLGAGINFILIADESPGSDVASVSYSDEFGFALQAGADFRMSDRWSFNADVKKVFVSTDVSVNGGAITAKGTDLDPWIIGFGLGYTF
jgi:outer membrane protein